MCQGSVAVRLLCGCVCVCCVLRSLYLYGFTYESCLCVGCKSGLFTTALFVYNIFSICLLQYCLFTTLLFVVLFSVVRLPPVRPMALVLSTSVVAAVASWVWTGTPRTPPSP